MALNWIEIRVVSRGSGQNVIARAAYNARENIRDERTGLMKEYEGRDGVEWKGIFIDPKQNAPAWMHDRGKLWNAVEGDADRSTRPDDAQLARDFKIALPHEHGDERNHHAHLLATMSEITPDGFGKKAREWNSKKQHAKWIERWSELGARHLKKAGFEVEAERFRFGHLKLEKQAEKARERGDMEWAEHCDREATKHLGPQAAALERRGIQTDIGNENREIQARNAARAEAQELREELADVLWSIEYEAQREIKWQDGIDAAAIEKARAQEQRAQEREIWNAAIVPDGLENGNTPRPRHGSRRGAGDEHEQEPSYIRRRMDDEDRERKHRDREGKWEQGNSSIFDAGGGEDERLKETVLDRTERRTIENERAANRSRNTRDR